jgi:hypothetical protein
MTQVCRTDDDSLIDYFAFIVNEYNIEIDLYNHVITQNGNRSHATAFKASVIEIDPVTTCFQGKYDVLCTIGATLP